VLGQGLLRQLVTYGRKVYGLGSLLGGVEDRRRTPRTGAGLVAMVVFYTGLLRIRSFNALEPRLAEEPFLRLVGAKTPGRLCSVDTVSRALRVMDLESLRAISVEMLRKAERNKVFREGWHGAFRHIAIDTARNVWCGVCESSERMGPKQRWRSTTTASRWRF